MKIGDTVGIREQYSVIFYHSRPFGTLVIHTLLLGISPFCSLSLPVLVFLFHVGYFLMPYLQIYLFFFCRVIFVTNPVLYIF